MAHANEQTPSDAMRMMRELRGVIDALPPSESAIAAAADRRASQLNLAREAAGELQSLRRNDEAAAARERAAAIERERAVAAAFDPIARRDALVALVARESDLISARAEIGPAMHELRDLERHAALDPSSFAKLKTLRAIERDASFIVAKMGDAKRELSRLVPGAAADRLAGLRGLAAGLRAVSTAALAAEDRAAVELLKRGAAQQIEKLEHAIYAATWRQLVELVGDAAADTAPATAPAKSAGPRRRKSA